MKGYLEEKLRKFSKVVQVFVGTTEGSNPSFTKKPKIAYLEF